MISRPIGSFKRPKNRHQMKKRFLSIPDITIPSVEHSPKISPFKQTEIAKKLENNHFFLP